MPAYLARLFVLHLAAALLPGVVGCGGAPALLQPAHPLPGGTVEYGAGVTTQVSLGAAEDQIARAEADPDPSRSAETERQWLRGAYQKSVVSPGVSPWVGARAGLGDGNEGSLVYTGRNLRLGARHAWRWDAYALSLGGGIASVLSRRPQDAAANDRDGLPSGDVSWSAAGFGLDVPLAFGWSSQSELVQAWAGLRGGFEALFGSLPFSGGGELAEAEAEALHFHGGGFVGLSIGISPVWLRVELNAAAHRVNAEASLPSSPSGDPERDRFTGFTLAPAGALLLQF
jgi:hypothetical protein